MEPCRARPVPFCLSGFLPPPRTSPRVFTLCVPCRAAASWATTTWCISGMFACTLKMSSGSSTVRVGSPPADRTSTLSSEGMSPTALLRRRADQHQRALGARDGALDQDQVLLRVDRLDGQVLHGVARVAHAPGHTHALEDPARRGAGADRAGRAVLALDTVAGAQAVEAVPLHHTREALALGAAGDVHDLTGREALRRHLLAERVLAGVGGTHLEVLARVLVLVRRADDAETVDLRGQRHRARDLRPGTGHRLHDLASRGVDDLVVIGLEPDADLLSRHGGFGFLLSMPLCLPSNIPAPELRRASLNVRPPRSGVSPTRTRLRPGNPGGRWSNGAAPERYAGAANRS